MRALTIPPDAEPVRLDVFLARHVPQCSRRTARRAISAGAVRINGRRARKGDLITNRDVVQISEDLFAPQSLQPNPRLALPVLFEDDALVAVDKPAGMPSHALHPDEVDTVANFLLALHPELATVGRNDREAGLVHRLDTDTSGVLLAARTASGYQDLRQQFSRHEVIKEYLALVAGTVRVAGVVRAPIAHDARDPRRMKVAVEGASGGREAATYFRPMERLRGATLLLVQIPTGVRHQIRLHLASIGHPLIGDRLYGEARPQAARHLLHAARLVVIHPETGQPLEIRSPLPVDFDGALQRLRASERGRAAPARRPRRLSRR